jgi:hypothetical protein
VGTPAEIPVNIIVSSAADGRLLPGAAVTIRQKGNVGVVFRTGITDEVGTARFQLPIGQYVFSVEKQFFISKHGLDLFVIGPTNKRVSLNPAAIQAEIFVKQNQAGVPVKDAQVDVENLFSGKTGNDGFVRFNYHVGDIGVHKVTASKEGHVPIDDLFINFPQEGISFSVILLTLSDAGEDPTIPSDDVRDAWDALNNDEKLARTIVIALSIIYGMRALQGFSAARFKPI